MKSIIIIIATISHLPYLLVFHNLLTKTPQANIIAINIVTKNHTAIIANVIIG